MLPSVRKALQSASETPKARNTTRALELSTAFFLNQVKARTLIGPPGGQIADEQTELRLLEATKPAEIQGAIDQRRSNPAATMLHTRRHILERPHVVIRVDGTGKQIGGACPHRANLGFAPAEPPCYLVHCRWRERITIAGAERAKSGRRCTQNVGNQKIRIVAPGTGFGSRQRTREFETTGFVEPERDAEPAARHVGPRRGKDPPPK